MKIEMMMTMMMMMMTTTKMRSSVYVDDRTDRDKRLAAVRPPP
jgi:hypothetical protein